MKKHIGVDLGGTNIVAARIGDQGIENKIKLNTLSQKQDVLNQLNRIITNLMTDEVEFIGLGVPGLVDVNTGYIHELGTIPSFSKVPLGKILKKKFGVSVKINNDANCFVLGEKKFGEGVNYDSIIGITLGTGIGVGIIVNGKLWAGCSGAAGEISDIPYLDHNLDYYCGKKFFVERNGSTGKDFFEMAEKGDKKALTIFEDYGIHLGRILSIIISIFNPSLIVLGGSISNAYKYLESTMNRTLKENVNPQLLKNVQIKKSKLFNSTIIGAAYLNLD